MKGPDSDILTSDDSGSGVVLWIKCSLSLWLIFQHSFCVKHSRHSQSSDRGIRCHYHSGTVASPGTYKNCFHFRFNETFFLLRSSPFLTSGYILILTTPLLLTTLRCSGLRDPPRDNRHGQTLSQTSIYTFPQKMFLRLVYFLQNIDVVCVASSESLDPSRLSSCYITGWGRRSEGKSSLIVHPNIFWLFLSYFSSK